MAALSFYSITTTTIKNNILSLLFLINLSLFLSYLPPSNCSLSTIAISESSNQTLVCASLLQSPNRPQSSYLNCTSFPSGGGGGGIQIPINSQNISVSGIVAGDGFVCYLMRPSSSSSSSSSTAAAVMGCWRFSSNGTNMSYKRIYRGPPLYEFDAGTSHICGIVNGTDQLECWQWYGFNFTAAHQKMTQLKYLKKSIAVGEDFVCGLSEIGKITCLGGDTTSNNSKVVGSEPAGSHYSVVAAGFRHACAISMEGNLECWGGEIMVNQEKQPSGEFTSLALGETRSCALRRNQTVVCWGGENDFNLPESLRETNFITIEAKRKIFCGVVASNYSLYCWGNEVFDSNNFMVFENVLPGPCISSDCPFGQLPGSGSLCEQGLHICLPVISPGENLLRPSLPPSLPPPPLSPPPQESSSRWNTKMVAFLVVGCLGSLSFVLLVSYSLFRYCCKSKGGSRVHDSGRLDETDEERGQATTRSAADRRQAPPPQSGKQPLEKRLSQLLSKGNGGHLEEFSLQVIAKATSNFSEDHKIGTGSFGSVYHATLDDGREVAIKRAETSTSSASYAAAGVNIGTKRGQEEDKDNAFLNELQFLSRLNHKNLVRLLGFCQESDERVLVYEYMTNGTLHDHLHKTLSPTDDDDDDDDDPVPPVLNSWPARLKVALDAARGIEYLHVYAVPPIIHRDIKSSNILLDENWTAKVSDFGLSLMGPEDEDSYLSLQAAGTVGYMDPEYYRLQQLSTKSDVYSFGVMLLELLSGYRAIHKNENGVHRNVVDVVVPYIVHDEIHRVLDRKVAPPTPVEIEAVAYVGYLATDCVTLEGRDRPSMTDIVNSLERALAACLEPPSLLSRSSTTSTTRSGPQH